MEDCNVENGVCQCRFSGCHWLYSTSDCDVGSTLVEYDQWHPEDVFPGPNFDFAILLSLDSQHIRLAQNEDPVAKRISDRWILDHARVTSKRRVCRVFETHHAVYGGASRRLDTPYVWCVSF